MQSMMALIRMIRSSKTTMSKPLSLRSLQTRILESVSTAEKAFPILLTGASETNTSSLATVWKVFFLLHVVVVIVIREARHHSRGYVILLELFIY